MPGTWLAVAQLDDDDAGGDGAGEPASVDEGCGCKEPRIWDGRSRTWRHLADGTACVIITPVGSAAAGTTSVDRAGNSAAATSDQLAGTELAGTGREPGWRATTRRTTRRTT
ncbi:MAG TPA: hypothetical protein VFT95_18425 [Micromonosporaceae bacterium]|nr:hypothetical protein [Micromonosporaceae bacterium]